MVRTLSIICLLYLFSQETVIHNRKECTRLYLWIMSYEFYGHQLRNVSFKHNNRFIINCTWWSLYLELGIHLCGYVQLLWIL